MKEEMAIISRYITGQKASEVLCERYERALQLRLAVSSKSNTSFLSRNSWALPFLDNATGWFSRNHWIRKRFEIAFSILETAPESAAYFQPSSLPWYHILFLAIRGLKSLLLALVGLPLLYLIVPENDQN